MSYVAPIRPKELARSIADDVRPLSDAGFDELLDTIGDSRLVLIGEATHGTHEFYQSRADLTKQLIQQKGFTAVAIEGDWPDTLLINSYVGLRADGDATHALRGFERFPTWMWRNTVVRDFIGWLRGFNESCPVGRQVGFFGLDLYSLYSSIDATIAYLDRVDPESARRARERYGCFETFGEDTQLYGYASSFGLAKGCEDEVVRQLMDLHSHAIDYESADGPVAIGEYFFAEQNARVVRNAERYYRAMFDSRVSSWNMRDMHMADTLFALENFYERIGKPFKVVVWAHNSHLGDARATQMGASGELNLGQLTRQQYEQDAFLIGFSTYEGTVTAASRWGAPADRKRVQPGLPGSYELLLHEVSELSSQREFIIPLRQSPAAAAALSEPRLERAIGVVYLPETERRSHYFDARLADQFDALVHIDQTRALEPLEQSARWQAGEPPETYPSGL